jgi:hypothetical protein
MFSVPPWGVFAIRYNCFCALRLKDLVQDHISIAAHCLGYLHQIHPLSQKWLELGKRRATCWPCWQLRIKLLFMQVIL